MVPTMHQASNLHYKTRHYTIKLQDDIALLKGHVNDPLQFLPWHCHKYMDSSTSIQLIFYVPISSKFVCLGPLKMHKLQGKVRDYKICLTCLHGSEDWLRSWKYFWNLIKMFCIFECRAEIAAMNCHICLDLDFLAKRVGTCQNVLLSWRHNTQYMDTQHNDI